MPPYLNPQMLESEIESACLLILNCLGHSAVTQTSRSSFQKKWRNTGNFIAVALSPQRKPLTHCTCDDKNAELTNFFSHEYKMRFYILITHCNGPTRQSL